MEAEGTLSLERAHQLADQRALIERARGGDASAIRALYDTHVDRIYRLTYRLTGVEHLARELTQDTFVRAFASIEGFRGDSAFGTWLHTIAVSTTLNELKRRKRERDRNARWRNRSAGAIAPYSTHSCVRSDAGGERSAGRVSNRVQMMTPRAKRTEIATALGVRKESRRRSSPGLAEATRGAGGVRRGWKP